jgi:myo-inositol catabolism protein IolS
MTERTSARKRRPATKRAPPAPPAPAGELPLGSTGRQHPGLGLGLWAMGRWTKDDETRTRAALDRALERGVRWFDTAEVYGTGRSERLLGDALVRHAPTAPPFLTTKVSWEHLRAAQVRASMTGSLQRLGLPSVDVYLVHAPDPKVPIAETMGALEHLWKEGKTRALGVSNFSVEEIEAAAASLREAPLVVNQVRYNLLNRTDGDAVVEHCRARGIVVEAYTPLARGLLAGRYLDGKPAPPEVRKFARDLFDRDRYPEVLARGRALRDLAEEADVPMASLALHWLRFRGAAPVFGASSAEQVDRVLEAWAVRPDDATLRRADEVTRGALD